MCLNPEITVIKTEGVREVEGAHPDPAIQQSDDCGPTHASLNLSFLMRTMAHHCTHDLLGKASHLRTHGCSRVGKVTETSSP